MIFIIQHSHVYVEMISKTTQVEKNAAFGRKALRLTLRFWRNRRVFRGKTLRFGKTQVFSQYFLIYSTIAGAENT